MPPWFTLTLAALNGLGVVAHASEGRAWAAAAHAFLAGALSLGAFAKHAIKIAIEADRKERTK